MVSSVIWLLLKIKVMDSVKFDIHILQDEDTLLAAFKIPILTAVV